MNTEAGTEDGTSRLRAQLARMLLMAEPGSRLPTVRELSKMLDRSVGSVQGELIRLQDAGAVLIERRGRSGMFVEARSVGPLWAAVEEGPMVAALPLPATRRFEGLATGIKSLLRSREIDTYFMFVRGSRRRMEALRSGRCHAAVMSVMAANELCSHGEEIVLELPEGSFVAGHAVFAVPTKRRKPLRVIVDPDSFDQQRLCEAQFADQEVELVPAPYMQFAQLLEDGEADATVWSLDEMEGRRSARIVATPLSPKAKALADDTDTRCCFVVRAGDGASHAVLVEALDSAALLAFQGGVVSGRTVPEY